MKNVIYFDGGYRPATGQGAAAAWLSGEKSKRMIRWASLRNADSQSAELYGLILAIRLAKELKLSDVMFCGDNKGVCQSLKGSMSNKSQKHRKLFAIAEKEVAGVRFWSSKWVPRSKNRFADKVCNRVMDHRSNKRVVDINDVIRPKPTIIQRLMAFLSNLLPASNPKRP